MTVNRFPIYFVFSIAVSGAVQAAQVAVVRFGLTEVFTTNDFPVTGESSTMSRQLGYSEIDLQLYDLSEIQQVEKRLSKGLPSDPDRSKHLARQRIQVMDGQTRVRMQRAAIGLAKAMRYGIDRYPAIVFDGYAVIYGVTDLLEAFARYQTWRAVDKP